MPDPKALDVAVAIEGTIRGRDQDLATKADIAVLHGDLEVAVAKLDGKIDTSSARLEAKVGNLKADLLLWFISTQIGAVAVILVVVRMMTGHQSF
jgi:hypothetical protein